MFVSSLLLSLAMMPDAAAANIPKIKTIRIRQIGNDGSTPTYSLTALTPDADATVASVSAELDGQSLALTESDAWVHGTATLAAAPADGAQVTLYVYATDSAVLDVFTGSTADGALALTGTGPDLDVLAATVYADGSVGIDLAGADAPAVAYARMEVKSKTTTKVCYETDKSGGCVKWYETTVETTEAAELDIDEVGVVWESDEITLEGAADLAVVAYDAKGKNLDKVKLDVATPWDDGGGGVNALPVDGDPLTTLAVVSCCKKGNVLTGWDLEKNTKKMVVVSDGWTLGDALPALAEIEIEDGESWSIPVNSYQVAGTVELGVEIKAIEKLSIDGDTLTRVDDGTGTTRRYDGDTASVEVSTDDDGVTWASVTAWAADPDDLPAGAILAVNGSDTKVAFVDQVAVVFALEVDLASDPHGLDILGSLELQGEADARGKRKTLSKGDFAGQLGVDGDGDLDLASIDESASTSPRGDILIGGEPIDIERTGTPPVLAKETNPKLRVVGFRRLQLGGN